MFAFRILLVICHRWYFTFISIGSGNFPTKLIPLLYLARKTKNVSFNNKPALDHFEEKKMGWKVAV